MSKIPNALKTIPRHISTNSPIDLKAVLAAKIPIEKEKITKFLKDHGEKKLGEVTINMIYRGMRGLKCLLCETSIVDPTEGVTFRGYNIPELQKRLPTAVDGKQPLPEGMLWLLLTNELPTKNQVNWLSKQMAERSEIPDHVRLLLKNLPSSLHPIGQLSCAITALHHDSKFRKAYVRGIPKSKYWEYIYEDSMDLLSKIIVIAAIIFRNVYRYRSPTSNVDPSKDWSHNFIHMMGFESEEMVEMIRLFITIYCDHEGGNVCSHATRLVGSALSDPYLSYAAGINGLAGPLHGLAIQDSLMWLTQLRDELGDNIHDHYLATHIRTLLAAGKIIPGYGHAVLRTVDPRYLCLREFALSHLPNDPLFKLLLHCYRIIPSVLKESGKVKNPWPNVDALSGVVLQYYKLDDMEFYTVMYAVGRAVGSLAGLIWNRALCLPIERPKSITTKALMKAVGAE